MIIDSKETICGVPILKVRNMVRKVRDFTFNRIAFKDYLDISAEKAVEIEAELLSRGWIKKDPMERDNGKYPWKTTIHGNAFANASAGRPITRKTAEKKISELLGRVGKINESSDFVFKIVRVVIFGSYLSGKDRLGDIDVGIKMRPKVSNEESFRKSMDECIERAREQGRRFGTHFAMLSWPENMVWKELKKRSTALSMHGIDRFVLSQTHKEIYRLEEHALTKGDS